jgi:uncharacterized membrane protein
MAGLPVERTSNGSGNSGGLRESGARLWLLARRAPDLTAMVAMALIGLGISIYLTIIHFQHVAPLCSTNGVVDCGVVTSSAFSVITLFGRPIPITIPGGIWFVVSGALAVIALRAIWQGRREWARLREVQLLWSLAGLVFVLYLVYAEIVALHKLCEWCTAVHVLTLITFLLALNRWLQRGLPLPVLDAAPARRNASNGATRQGSSMTRQPQAATNGVRRAPSANNQSNRRAHR